MKAIIARWETRGKKHWYELYEGDTGLTYSGYSGGHCGNATEEQALEFIESRIADAKRYDGINMTKVALCAQQ